MNYEEASVTTLERVFEEELGLAERKVFSKMDTQGYDLEVFKGLGSYVNNVCCLLSEISVPTYRDALGVYEKAGFAVTGLYPVSRDTDLSLIEFDCFMVSKGGW